MPMSSARALALHKVANDSTGVAKSLPRRSMCSLLSIHCSQLYFGGRPSLGAPTFYLPSSIIISQGPRKNLAPNPMIFFACLATPPIIDAPLARLIHADECECRYH